MSTSTLDSERLALGNEKSFLEVSVRATMPMHSGEGSGCARTTALGSSRITRRHARGRTRQVKE